MQYRLYENEFALPHAKISSAVFRIVEDAVCIAWEHLRVIPRSTFNILTADEDTITEKLREILCDEIFGKWVIDGFSHELFERPTRDAKIPNFDGTKSDLMPDLLIGMVNRPTSVRNSSDGLFIECKPVDDAHPVVVHYCKKGIIRFVIGDYAWAMTSALMIGYVRNGYTISTQLSPALREREEQFHTIQLPSPWLNSQPRHHCETVHVSEHNRTFSYVETGEQAPSITLHHLWLRRD